VPTVTFFTLHTGEFKVKTKNYRNAQKLIEDVAKSGYWANTSYNGLVFIPNYEIRCATIR
jgi:hypothetical protein